MTEGTPLFFAACAATAAEDPAVADFAVDLVAKLIAAGADPNGDGGGTRPGVAARCGARLPPLALALAALEEAAADDDKSLRRIPAARLAAILLAAPDCDAAARVVFTHRPDAREFRSRRVVPGAPDASFSSSSSASSSLLASARVSAVGGSFASGARMSISGGGEGVFSASDLRNGAADAEVTAVNQAAPSASMTVPATGTPLWFAACGVVEGAGAPALNLAKKILALGADPNCVGSRPGHCGAGTPLLAMTVAALEGRPIAAPDASWWPSGGALSIHTTTTITRLNSRVHFIGHRTSKNASVYLWEGGGFSLQRVKFSLD